MPRRALGLATRQRRGPAETRNKNITRCVIRGTERGLALGARRMSRSKAGLRKLVFDGATYLWKVKHEHHVLEQTDPLVGRCREVLLVRRVEPKGRALRIEFADTATCHAGYPEAGVVWQTGSSEGNVVSANLNLPRMVRAAIEVCLAQGWQPDSPSSPSRLDGWPMVTEIISRYEALAPR